MKINEIIKNRRNAKGLTQEQVADYLGVSTPAVNKWEKGSCYPDITTLPALARLLSVDLNTLLSFKEDLTEKEIGIFTNELVGIINSKGFDIGFKKVIDKIYEYPTCDKLIITSATVLQGSLYMFAVENKDYYDEHIDKLFLKVVDSNNVEVKNKAVSMLINKYLQKGDYEKAQGMIDNLPDITFDKRQLQANLFCKSGEFDKAAEIYEQKLILAATDIFTSLTCMMEIALKEGRNVDAEYFATVLNNTAKLYDLWDYNLYSSYFQLYIAKQDEENSIRILKNMLDSMSKKWDLSKSNLYKHIKAKEHNDGYNEQFISNFLNMLKNDLDNELSFLKDNKKFNELINYSYE